MYSFFMKRYSTNSVDSVNSLGKARLSLTNLIESVEENWKLWLNQSVVCPAATLLTKSAKAWNRGINWPVWAGFRPPKFKRNLLLQVSSPSPSPAPTGSTCAFSLTTRTEEPSWWRRTMGVKSVQAILHKVKRGTVCTGETCRPAAQRSSSTKGTRSRLPEKAPTL